MKKTIFQRLKQYMARMFNLLSETLETCEWFPCPRQTKLPPFDYKRGDN